MSGNCECDVKKDSNFVINIIAGISESRWPVYRFWKFCFKLVLLLKRVLLLWQNLATLLITQQITQQILESIVPYIFYRFRKVNVEKRHQFDNGSKVEKYNISIDVKLQAEIERTKDEYSVSTMHSSALILFVCCCIFCILYKAYCIISFWQILKTQLISPLIWVALVSVLTLAFFTSMAQYKFYRW